MQFPLFSSLLFLISSLFWCWFITRKLIIGLSCNYWKKQSSNRDVKGKFLFDVWKHKNESLVVCSHLHFWCICSMTNLCVLIPQCLILALMQIRLGLVLFLLYFVDFLQLYNAYKYLTINRHAKWSVLQNKPFSCMQYVEYCFAELLNKTVFLQHLFLLLLIGRKQSISQKLHQSKNIVQLWVSSNLTWHLVLLVDCGLLISVRFVSKIKRIKPYTSWSIFHLQKTHCSTYYLFGIACGLLSVCVCNEALQVYEYIYK